MASNETQLRSLLSTAAITDFVDQLRKLAAGVELVVGQVVGEIVNESADGSRTAFTVDNPIFSGSEAVHVNGSRKTRTTDYTVSGSTITFGSAPASAAVIVVDYQKS